MPIKQVFAYYDWQRHQAFDGFKYCPFCQARLVLVESGQQPRPTCPSCGFVQYKNPLPAVSILIANNNKVLLGKRNSSPGKGQWAIPSGYIEFNDDFISTAIQETKEETGLEVEIKSILNVISSFFSPSFHFLVIYVEAHIVAGEPVAGDDLDEVKWFPVSGPLPEMAFQEDIDMLDMHARKELVGLPIDSRYACQSIKETGYGQ